MITNGTKESYPEQKAMNANERQAVFKKRMKAINFKRVSVWVHEEDVRKVKNFAATLAAGAKRIQKKR